MRGVRSPTFLRWGEEGDGASALRNPKGMGNKSHNDRLTNSWMPKRLTKKKDQMNGGGLSNACDKSEMD